VSSTDRTRAANALASISAANKQAREDRAAWDKAMNARDKLVIDALKLVAEDGRPLLSKSDIAKALDVRREHIYNIINRKTKSRAHS
jgi:DNA invertase Pin-like site-specific DNA recombinase